MPYKNTTQVLNVTLQKEITTELVKEIVLRSSRLQVAPQNSYENNYSEVTF